MPDEVPVTAKQFLASYKPLAHHAVERAHEVRESMSTGVADQYDAAARDTMTTAKVLADSGVFPFGGFMDGTPEEKATRLMLVFEAAKQRNCIEGCEHVPASVMIHMPCPVVIELGRRLVICKNCRDAETARIYVDDGLCDFCQRPGTLFTPAVVSIGPITLIGDLCDECKEGFTEAFDTHDDWKITTRSQVEQIARVAKAEVGDASASRRALDRWPDAAAFWFRFEEDDLLQVKPASDKDLEEHG